MDRFYLPHWKKGLPVSLPKGESKHCIKVLRKKAGDQIQAIDGQGNLLLCEIMTADPGEAVVHVERIIQREEEPDNFLELVVSPTKQMKRMEWMAEKCTEIGLRKLSFLRTRFGERPKISKRYRLERVMLSAVKQSRHLWLPELGTMDSLKEICEASEQSQIRTVVSSSERDGSWLGRQIEPGAPIRVIIGPEGGFHEAELKIFDQYSIPSVHLGPSILRTETAGIYASALWQFVKRNAEPKESSARGME